MAHGLVLVRKQFTRVTPLLIGLLAAAGSAGLASVLGGLTPLPPIFYVLLLGMAIGWFVPQERLSAGAAFASHEVLRCGVALLGTAITFNQFAQLGYATVILTVGSLLITLIVGTWLCRAFGEGREMSIISAAAVAICGASAALAVAAACSQDSANDNELARTIAGITIAGTLAMFILPLLGGFLDLPPLHLGILLGGSLHEVAQATASGLAVSDEVGKAATLVKMLRVGCMGAIVAAVPFFIGRSRANQGRRPPLFPGFLIAFAILATVSSVGLIPPVLRAVAVDISRWCLLIAIAALGMRTSLAILISAGARPLIAIALNSILIATLMLSGVMLLDA